MKIAHLCLATIFLLASMDTHGAGPQCNTRGGYVASQPETPLDAVDEPLRGPIRPKRAMTDVNSARLKETIPVDLSQLDELIELEGRYTTGIPVLGLRIENYPTFDPKKDCNRIQVKVIKPKIERVEGGRWRASVENGRFRTEFEELVGFDAVVQDRDPSKRFFWIFPKVFGKKQESGAPWKLTGAYNSAYRAAPVGSVRRRWIAEAYLNLALRTYRMRKLVASYPEGGTPARKELHDLFALHAGAPCGSSSKNLVCAVADLIELNEAAPNGEQLSPEAFRTGDALLENSGVSTGLRQLDFASTNDQAAQVGPKLSKTLFATTRGYGYLRPIRTWEVDVLHAWYVHAGPSVNKELSSGESKSLLLRSHVDFVKTAVVNWSSRIDKAYPQWPMAERSLLTIIAIDLENVTGRKLDLNAGADGPCAVLTLASLSGRSNASIAKSQSRRVTRAARLSTERFGAIQDASCLSVS